MRQTLDRAGKFLRLVALLAALLSAVAVALAARAFANRHLDDCAMLRVLGQSQRNIAWTYTLEFLAVGIVASLTGLCLGFGLHLVFGHKRLESFTDFLGIRNHPGAQS
jgi:putative ABC transport system permease protein